MENKNYFKLPEKQSNLEKRFKNNWISINIPGNGFYQGKLKEVNGTEIVLNPHKSFRLNKEKGLNLYKIVEEDLPLEISQGLYVPEPTNKETIDYFIEDQNNKIIREKEKELSSKTNLNEIYGSIINSGK